MGDVAEVLSRLGGVAGRAALEQHVGRTPLETAVSTGAVVRVARGRYALPTGDEARRAAQRLTGTAVLLSAAAHWGWATKWQISISNGRSGCKAL